MDSLDLTFVRCPSCRSLVPAISTRCRMCGASLEASSESLSGAMDKSSGAAGSATSSSGAGSEGLLAKSDSESGAAKGSGSKSDADRSGVIKFNDGKRADEPTDPLLAVGADDPLGMYVEEIGDTAAVEATKDDEAGKESSTLAGAVEVSATSVTGDSLIEAVSSSSGASTLTSGAGNSAEVELGGVDSTTARRSTEARVDPMMKADAARGTDSKSERTGSERTGESGQPAARQPFEARRNSQERRYQQPNPQGGRDSGTNRENNNVNRRAEVKGGDMKGSESRGVEMRGSEGRGVPVSSGSNALARTPAVVQGSGVAAAARPRETQVFGSGRLVGWLVSYADTRGSSLELREGKFFVTAKSIKENDLVLEDRSVSTPHALVGCGRDGTLTVQDLMSDRGVFVRRRGSNQYRQEEESIPVEHGDWLRFGDLEFLVVLIPAGME